MGRKDHKNIVLVLALFCWLFAACNKPEPAPAPAPSSSEGKKVYVVCEGSLGNGNSALSLYFPAKDSVYEDVYKSVNHQSIGDVFQSMTLIGDNYFLCVNNSDKILVIGKKDWVLKASITIPKPRYILPVTSSKAYVSTLFNDKVYIIDPDAMQSKGYIPMPSKNPEGMLRIGNTAYISTWDTATNNLYKMDMSTDLVSTAATLSGRAPQEAVLDKENKLWVMAGNVVQGKNATLTRIDPSNGQVIKTYQFPAGADAMRPVLTPAKDSVYFIEVNYTGGTQYNGIYRMGINDASLPTQPFLAAVQFQYFWALGIEPSTGHIYVGDPKGFNQKGSVYIYKPDGTKITQFSTGVGPGHFYFED